MRLDSIGLKLEHSLHDSDTDTHAFVASNVSEQVEGEEDSIIVVAFRGSASLSNIKTDLSFRQVSKLPPWSACYHLPNHALWPHSTMQQHFHVGSLAR